MPRQGFADSTILAEWADKECRHLDLINSWETLLTVYEALGFTDKIDDDRRLEEFKTVITELNKFLTRMKNGLNKTTDVEDAIEFLANHASVSDMNTIRSRASIAYNKLKQRWISQAIAVLVSTREAEGERDDR